MNPPRHILMCTRVLPHHSIGGMQAVAWDLARGFTQRGLRVSVLTTEIPGRPATFSDAGVEIHSLPGTSSRRYGHSWWQRSRKFYEQHFLGKCDLVLSVSAAGFALLAIRQQTPNVPFVLQAHGTSIAEVISKWRSGSLKSMASSVRNAAWVVKDLIAYRQFDSIVAVGERVADSMRTWPMRHFASPGRLHLIPNGIDTSLFSPNATARVAMRKSLGIGDAEKLVISVGRLHKQKGVSFSLAGFAALSREFDAARLIVLGDGPELSPLKEYAHSLGIAHQVHFVGGVAHEHIPDYLNASDAFLFTTTHLEGRPLNVLEALAVGLPVVASCHLYANATPEEHIFPVSPTDSDEVAAALHRALTLTRDGHSKLPAGCSSAESLNRYLALFTSLCAEQAQNSPGRGVHDSA